LGSGADRTDLTGYVERSQSQKGGITTRSSPDLRLPVHELRRRPARVSTQRMLPHLDARHRGHVAHARSWMSVMTATTRAPGLPSMRMTILPHANNVGISCVLTFSSNTPFTFQGGVGRLPNACGSLLLVPMPRGYPHRGVFTYYYLAPACMHVLLALPHPHP